MACWGVADMARHWVLDDPKALAAVLGRRRRGVASGLPAGNAQLVADLGGNAEVIAFYDVRAGITLATGVSQWNDCRGAVGYGPSLVQATGANQPARTGTGDSDYEVNFDGTDDFMRTASSALFDNSGAAALIFIGSADSAFVDGRYFCYTGDSAAFGRALALRCNATAALEGAAKGGTFGPGGAAVVPSTTRRLMIVAQDATTGATFEIANRAENPFTGVDQASGNNILALGSHATGAGFVPIKVRAVIRLAHEITAGEVSAVKTWATTYHPYTAVT